MNPLKHPKRSFLKLPASIDHERLLKDYESLLSDDWRPSYWTRPHCSVEMVLLRGGLGGDPTDFHCDVVADQPVLARLPYIRQLVGGSGPFGQATYAFMFRMQPGGITRLHPDGAPAWHVTYRIHIAITTALRSVLVVEGQRGQHYGLGEAWTFDNQKLHGFINGDAVRTHLIMDVPENDKLEELLRKAEYHPGEPVSDADWARVSRRDSGSAPIVPFTTTPLLTSERAALGLADHWPASRIVRTQAQHADLSVGDIVVVEAGLGTVDRDVAQHIRMNQRPGDEVVLIRIRQGTRQLVTLSPLQADTSSAGNVGRGPDLGAEGRP